MRKFKTESKKLLDLMINSIYTNREIFLRELISNASDASDKMYFKALTDESIPTLGRNDLKIRVSFDKEARTITVSDNGIGMDADALEKNLGTIAHSDSLAFKTENAAAATAPASGEEAAAANGEEAPASTEEVEVESSHVGGGDVDIIGQFGVGFYSAFMVAKHVRVVSRAWDADQAWAWDSDGVEGYTIEPAEKETRGTDIILSVKDNTDDDNYDEYLSEYGLKELIKHYSNYVRYSIVMNVTKSRELPKPEDAGDDYKPEYEEYKEDEVINSMVPIWKRRKSEVKDEEYNEFYKAQFHDYADPARVISFHAEGGISYDVLLFIPSRAPFDLYSKEYKRGLELYSSNVLIMENCEDLVPECFGFVKGVVDSQDLSLNISRETLQQNRQLRAIAHKIEKKIKSELVKMCADDREGYEKFFANFGRSLKFGIYSSYGMHKDLLGDLLLFHSAKEQKLITLDEYIEAEGAVPELVGEENKDAKKAIYYASGEQIERLGKLPLVKNVLSRGYDVLLCTEDVDEFVLGTMFDYKEHEFKNVMNDDLGLDSESDKAALEAASKLNEGLLGAMKEALGDKVAKVEVSNRLGDAAAAVTAEGPISLEMERIMAQMPTGGDSSLTATRVLEVNPDHPVFETLKAAQETGDTDKVTLYTEILYNQALLVNGMSVEDPTDYAQKVLSLMK